MAQKKHEQIDPKPGWAEHASLSDLLPGTVRPPDGAVGGFSDRL